ncbi:MAG: hypothetical protein JST55_16585 [Bacteroidetes bacterium]|nr:hypothetical protein [Bacteroidota bacterium]
MNQNKIENEKFPELRLLSLNEARKRLGIRRGNLLKLIRDKKLISKTINNKIYVPVQSIISYVTSFDMDELESDVSNKMNNNKVGERENRHSSLYQIMKSRIKK